MSKKDIKGITVKKDENFSEWYTQVIEKAELIDIRHGLKGFVVIRPWAAMTMENMFSLYEEALQKKGHLPTFFPTVVSEKNLTKESDHVAGFTPEVFWLQSQKGEEKMALRPTSETMFTPMFALWIRGHKELPMKLYQRGSVFRYDTKSTRPLIRGREFIWIEAHDAFATKEAAEKQVQEDIETTEEVMHQKFGIPFLPMKRPSWDKFAGAEYTIGSDVIMPDGKLIQQPSTHLLGQKFSKAFGAKFLNEEEKEDYIWTTAYGPAISRILASVISTHGDDKGLILPYEISPIKVVIIPIFKKENKEKILKKCKDIQSKFNSLNIKTKLDDRDQYSVGYKFNEYEIKGIPFRLELGELEIKKKKATLYIRDTNNKEPLPIKDLSKIKSLGKEYDKRLIKKADDFLKGKIVNCSSKQDIKKALSKGKIVRVNFCSVEKQGIKCADSVEKDFTAEVRGTIANKKEAPKGKCVICDKKASAVVYIGKSY
jgi:prolyl-tRNA synthetase